MNPFSGLLGIVGAIKIWLMPSPWEAALRSSRSTARDWDRIIAAGEAQLAATPDAGNDRERIALPLGVAYHQRASRSSAQGDVLEALRDVDRAIALDPFYLPYLITRSVLLDAQGRRAEASRGIDAVILLADARRQWRAAERAWGKSLITSKEFREVKAAGRAAARRVDPALAQAHDDVLDRLFIGEDEKLSLSDEELARAHATRGMIAFREGNLEQAERDLRRAMELVPSAFHAHCLGAALYARGDVAGAAEAEEQSVELEPSNVRYRWALTLSLRKLGRTREAREHANLILEAAPDVAAAYRERIARLF